MKSFGFIRTYLLGLTIAALGSLGAPAALAECTDRYLDEGTLVIDQGGAFYDSVTGEATCLPPQNPNARAVQRPLSDFLRVQGTFCFPDGGGGAEFSIRGFRTFSCGPT